MKNLISLFVFVSLIFNGFAQTNRERINLDNDWYFAFGHSSDKAKDFNTGTSYFTYLAKARYGADGAAAINFDHRAWRKLNLPHDWAVEMPFNWRGSHSHGYKAVGPGFPDVSVGWYRKTIAISEDDFGKQLFIDFDGVSRDAKVWVNGHYLGNEPSGYQSFSFNISDIVNYGGDNVIAVRADVSMEEGWYYEGAGIYRHVWMRKTPALHIPKDGTFVYSNIDDKQTTVHVKTEVSNKGLASSTFNISHSLVDNEGKTVATVSTENYELVPQASGEYESSLNVADPHLWSINDPYLHKVVTQLKEGEKIVDEYETTIGIRSIYFDADYGFFLNGEHVKLKGTNNHQDHAGVGCAMPDELIRWRLQQLKNFGSNAIRSSHNPPTPELLSLCDEMGILVIDENRLMGTSENALNELGRLIKRDRNHPSVIVWSVGNEEWGIEGNEIGARMTQTMQNYAKLHDPSRPVNVAISGGWMNGSSSTVEIMGFNYLVHGDTDEFHKKYPNKPCIGTEEGSTHTTRGIYLADDEKHYKTAYDIKPTSNWFTIQDVWKHYAERDYLAGMFIWTGFDYRGEPTPYGWPSVTSYFGMMDLCGFPKDNVFYLKSWWQNEPVLHILPHWNWQGHEGDTIDVWVYSNCEEVVLKLNGEPLGEKSMETNGHLSWNVPYQKGTLEAIAYTNNKQLLTAKRVTSEEPSAIKLSSSKVVLKVAEKDIAMITVEVMDENGNAIPTADTQLTFEIDGPGKIIGVGNGNPTSLEKDVFVDRYAQIEIPEVEIYSKENEIAVKLMAELPDEEITIINQLENVKVLYSKFTLNNVPQANQSFTWFYNHVGHDQRIYSNGQLISPSIKSNADSVIFNVENLQKGSNDILIFTEPFSPKQQWDRPNKKPGVIQVKTKAGNWERKLFNGLAQVIVQSTSEQGELILKAKADGLESSEIKIKVQ